MAHRTTLLKWMTKLKLKRWQWWINHQQVIWLNIYWTHCPCPFKLALTKWMLIVSKAKVYRRFIISLSGDLFLSLQRMHNTFILDLSSQRHIMRMSVHKEWSRINAMANDGDRRWLLNCTMCAIDWIPMLNCFIYFCVGFLVFVSTIYSFIHVTLSQRHAATVASTLALSA